MTNHAMNRSASPDPDSAPASGPGGDRPEYARAKAGWPKTADGTIDWETVFEAPDTGLIAMLADVDRPDVLYKVTETIIRQLFTRKGDEIEVERFLIDLTRIVEDGEDIASTRGSVIDLLRRIKNGRIQKAAAYVAEQKRKAALGMKERRRAKRREADRKVALKTRLMLMVGGGLAAVLLLAGVLFVLVDGTPGMQADTEPAVPASPAEAPAGEALAGKASAGDPPAGESWGRYDPSATFTPESEISLKTEPKREYTADGYPLGRMSREDLKELGEHVMTLPPIRFSRNVGGGAAQQAFVAPVLSIRDPDQWTDICRWAPSLTEAISGIMVRAIPSAGEVAPSDYRAAGQVAMQLMNSRMGGVLIDDVFLLYDVETSLIDASARCSLVTGG